MLNIDMRTVSLIALTSYVALALGLQLVNRVIRNEPSIRLWTSGVTLIGVASVLIGLRGIIPDVASIVIANAIAVFGLGQIYRGFRRHYDLAEGPRWDVYAALFVAATFAYFSYVDESLASKIVIASLVIAALSFAIAHLLIFSEAVRFLPDRIVPLFLGMVFGGYGTYMVIRAGLTPYYPLPTDFMQSTAAIHTLLPMLVATIANVCLSIGLPLMIAARMQRNLRASETKYREVVENANAIILRMSLDGTVSYFNEYSERFFGFSAAEILGRHVVGTIVPERESHTNRDLSGLIAAIIEDTAHHEEIENENVTRDGRRVIVHWKNHIIRDAHGKSQGVLSIGHDVTDRKRYEEAMRQSALYARSLIEASLDPLVTISPDGKITDTNQATETITGRPRAELVGSDFSSYFTEPERARAGYEQVLAEGRVTDYPLAIRHQSGTVALVRYNASIYRNEAGEVQGIFAAARDVTEYETVQLELAKYQANLEQLVEVRTAELNTANQIKSRFLANMSHELRTPLNHIFGFTSLLAREVTSDRAKDRLYKIELASKHLLHLIDNILNVSRIESGRLASTPADFDLDDALNRVENGARLKAEGKHLMLSVERSPDLPKFLHGDSSAISQVLDCLLDNAVKFSEHGDIQLRVSHRHELTKGSELRFEVEDQGIGIPVERQSGLFQLFTQGDDSQTRKYGGAGIGLALAKRLVMVMGGDIGFTSSPGQGSTFWFCVPVREIGALTAE